MIENRASLIAAESAHSIKAPVLLSGLLLVGLYGPSSIGGEYSSMLWMFYLAVLAAAFAAIAIKSSGLGSKLLCVNSVLIGGVLFAATLVSPFAEYRWGGMLGFWLLALLLLTQLRRLSGSLGLRSMFLAANIANVLLGVAILAGSAPAGAVLTSAYSAFYPELVPHMLEMHKPILTFSSHSLAAFFCYLLFFINFESYKRTRQGRDLFFSFAYIFFCFVLQSFTGMSLLLVAVLQMTRFFARKSLALTGVALLALSASILWAVVQYFPDAEERALVGQLLSASVNSDANGFLGRFSSTGTLSSTVAYIRDRPFSPVGVGYRSDLVFGDSGVVEYYLRGSVILVLSIYGGLYLFLKQNLCSPRQARFLFFLALAFETGFSSLTYIRTLYLLPVFIVYLNDLEKIPSLSP